MINSDKTILKAIKSGIIITSAESLSTLRQRLKTHPYSKSFSTNISCTLTDLNTWILADLLQMHPILFRLCMLPPQAPLGELAALP